MKTFLITLSIFLSAPLWADEQVLRIGHLANLTHAPALAARNSSRTGGGILEKHLGSRHKIEWYSYNAGPSVTEALLLGNLDAAYVGPNPAINAFVRTHGKEVRIIGGSTFGGAGLALRKDLTITSERDFIGKRIATPQLGNTQDISAREWFLRQGLEVTQTGGQVLIVPTENPDQLDLMRSGQLDGAWTVEPWLSILVRKAEAKVYLRETDALTTLMVVSAKFAAAHPKEVRALVEGNSELSAWVTANPAAAQAQTAAELAAITSKPSDAELIKAAWPSMRFDSKLTAEQLGDFVASAQHVGFLKEAGDISGIMYAGK